MIENFTTATPVEIDTELAALYAKKNGIMARAESLYGTIASTIGREIHKTWNSPKATPDEIKTFLADADEDATPDYTRRQLLEWWERYEGLMESAMDVVKDMEPYDLEFDRRGGWTRAFLVVTSGRGHVHSSMDCSTTYSTTQFHWMTDYSAKTQAEIIDAAGERACTVCYPDAPVDAKGTRMFTPDEIEAQRKREERAAKKAAADAAKITVTWTDDFNGRVKDREFKTLRGLTNELASIIDNLVWYGETHPSASAWVANLVAGGAIARAQGWDYDKTLKTKRNKAKKEGFEPKF